MRVTAARLNCVPVRSHKVSTDLRGCVVTMRGTSPTIVVTSSALQSVRSTRRICLPWWVIKRTRSIRGPLRLAAFRTSPSGDFEEKASGSSHEPLHCLCPLLRCFAAGLHVLGPGAREVKRRSDEERETFVGTGSPPARKTPSPRPEG